MGVREIGIDIGSRAREDSLFDTHRMLRNARDRSVASTEKFEFCTGRYCVCRGNPVLDADFPVFSTECDRSHVGIMQVRGHVVRPSGEES